MHKSKRLVVRKLLCTKVTFSAMRNAILFESFLIPEQHAVLHLVQKTNHYEFFFCKFVLKSHDVRRDKPKIQMPKTHCPVPARLIRKLDTL